MARNAAETTAQLDSGSTDHSRWVGKSIVALAALRGCRCDVKSHMEISHQHERTRDGHTAQGNWPSVIFHNILMTVITTGDDDLVTGSGQQFQAVRRGDVMGRIMVILGRA